MPGPLLVKALVHSDTGWSVHLDTSQLLLHSNHKNLSGTSILSHMSVAQLG